MSLFSRLSTVQRQLDQVQNNTYESIGPRDQADGAVRSDHSSNVTNNRPINHASSSSTAGTLESSRKDQKNIQAKAGVLIRTIKPGDLVNYPQKGDTCTIHYEAFIENEIVNCRDVDPVPFDSSRSRNQMFCFRLGEGHVIEGLDETVSKLSVGQLVEATIPYAYGYGVAGYPPVIPPRATLIFRVELISFSSVL